MRSRFQAFPEEQQLAIVKYYMGDDPKNHLSVWLAVISGKRFYKDGSSASLL